MKLSQRLVAFLAGLTFSSLGLPPAHAAPVANNIDIQLTALRLQINDYTTRYQLKVVLTVTSEAEAQVAIVEDAVLLLANPHGDALEFAPHKTQTVPKQFKAARGVAMFKVIEDASDPEISNVPAGFFGQADPLKLQLELAGNLYSGVVDFNTPVQLSVTQVGRPVVNFSLAMEQPFSVQTDPAVFGPVYYRKQDLTNFVFQLASINQALDGGDFHAPVESPQYLFQVQIGDGEGGPTRLVPPGRYIDGYSSHMIRSEQTATPLLFQPEEYQEGEVVVIDFQRKDTMPPDSVFAGPGDNLTSRVLIINRAIYALFVEAPPTPEELGLVPETHDE